MQARKNKHKNKSYLTVAKTCDKEKSWFSVLDTVNGEENQMH